MDPTKPRHNRYLKGLLRSYGNDAGHDPGEEIWFRHKKERHYLLYPEEIQLTWAFLAHVKTTNVSISYIQIDEERNSSTKSRMKGHFYTQWSAFRLWEIVRRAIWGQEGDCEDLMLFLGDIQDRSDDFRGDLLEPIGPTWKILKEQLGLDGISGNKEVPDANIWIDEVRDAWAAWGESEKKRRTDSGDPDPLPSYLNGIRLLNGRGESPWAGSAYYHVRPFAADVEKGRGEYHCERCKDPYRHQLEGGVKPETKQGANKDGAEVESSATRQKAALTSGEKAKSGKANPASTTQAGAKKKEGPKKDDVQGHAQKPPLDEKPKKPEGMQKANPKTASGVSGNSSTASGQNGKLIDGTSAKASTKTIGNAAGGAGVSATQNIRR